MELHGGTVLRIKRKRDAEPLDALLVAATALPHEPAKKRAGGLQGLRLDDDDDDGGGGVAAGNAAAAVVGPAAAGVHVFRRMDTLGLSVPKNDQARQLASRAETIRRARRR